MANNSNAEGLQLFRNTISALTVFFVALPLCLGIALASEVPLMSGLLAGIVGGLVVGALSASPFSIAGPAAGLIAIVLTGVEQLGTFEAFLAACLIAGVFQLVAGYLHVGEVAKLMPMSVIKGMMTAIGLIIISKQIPYLFGFDKAGFNTAVETIMREGRSRLSAMAEVFGQLGDLLTFGALAVGLICLAFLFTANHFQKKSSVTFIQRFPVGLATVALGMVLGLIFASMGDTMMLSTTDLVQLPENIFSNLSSAWVYPDTAAFLNTQTYFVAFTLFLVASLQSLLTVEAIDTMDPLNRKTPLNRELMAQGAGNVVASIVGSLPMTAVIVRATANIDSGATNRTSTMMQGMFLLLGVLFFAPVLNHIPLAALAAILIHIGLRLVDVKYVRGMFKQHFEVSIPYFATVLFSYFMDLLVGIGIGAIISLVFIAYHLFHDAVESETEEDPATGQVSVHVSLPTYMTFMHRARLQGLLKDVPPSSRLVIEGRHVKKMHTEVRHILDDFHVIAGEKNIDYQLKRLNA